MGHIRLGTLPKTRPWNEVVLLLGQGSGVEEVAAATSTAARLGFEQARNDPALIEAFWLLTQVPLAARAPDFVDRLGRCGIVLEGPPTLIELASGFAEAVDTRLRAVGGRTDLGEMAELAAVETLAKAVERKLPGLFGATPQDVQSALASFGTRKQFGDLARAFFARFAERYLGYYLSRTLSTQVGEGARFRSVDDHTAFNAALSTHCFEAARIVRDFAGEWYSKTAWERGISRERVAEFSYTAFRKLGEELRQRDGGTNGR